MKLFFQLFAVVSGLISCDNNSGSKPVNVDLIDSVKTDSLKNPSYNPAVKADSAAKHMNLDSTEFN